MKCSSPVCVVVLLHFLCIASSCSKEPNISLRVFREIPSPIADDCASVWMIDSSRGVIVGGTPWKTGFVLSTADGGLNWQTDTLMNRKVEGVMFDCAGQGYACGQDFILYRPPNSRYWDDFRVNFNWNKACHFPDSKHGVMASGGAYQFGELAVFGTEAFWHLDTLHKTPNAMADVWFSDSVTAHAVGIGWVLRSADAGRTWQRYDVTGDFFCSVQFPTSLTGYICGSSGTILKTTDAGQSWKTIRTGGSTSKRNQPFRSLWFVSADTGYVVGDGGLFWRTENGGSDWSQIKEVPENVDFTDIFASGNRGWAVAKNGRIFYFEN